MNTYTGMNWPITTTAIGEIEVNTAVTALPKSWTKVIVATLILIEKK